MVYFSQVYATILGRPMLSKMFFDINLSTLNYLQWKPEKQSGHVAVTVHLTTISERKIKISARKPAVSLRVTI